MVSKKKVSGAPVLVILVIFFIINTICVTMLYLFQQAAREARKQEATQGTKN